MISSSDNTDSSASSSDRIITAGTIREAIAIVIVSSAIAFLINALYHPSPLPWLYEARKVESASSALFDSLMAPSSSTNATSTPVGTTSAINSPSVPSAPNHAMEIRSTLPSTPTANTSQAATSTRTSSGAAASAAGSDAAHGRPPLKLPVALSYEQVQKLLANTGSATFIDARKKEEHEKGAFSNSLNVDVLQFQANPQYRDECMRLLYSLPKDKIVVAYCGGGNCELSHELCDILIPMGFTKVFIYLGGWSEYKEKQGIK